ncbi:26s proteasome regulatory subunit 7 [Quercus suber]|uniref:26s proteasome regulatory subunit 7 n=1 Tax=Quercus suber TaxID=58331 RepID=A0AAW0K4F8_QUESU|nr:26s protease regulatory subunit 7a [Quercus suber]
MENRLVFTSHSAYRKGFQSMAPEADHDIKDDDEKNPRPLDEDDIALLKTYGLGPYSNSIKKVEKEIKEMAKKVNDLCVKNPYSLLTSKSSDLE